jgi:peroxiredoxin
LPLIQQVFGEESTRLDGAVIYGISQGYPAETVGKFMSDNQYSFPVLIDPTTITAGIKSAFKAYDIVALPSTFFIDKHGIITNIETGSFDSVEEITAILDTLR